MINERMNTQVKGEYDVAVCGGGFAGISAALAASPVHFYREVIKEKGLVFLSAFL